MAEVTLMQFCLLKWGYAIAKNIGRFLAGGWGICRINLTFNKRNAMNIMHTHKTLHENFHIVVAAIASTHACMSTVYRCSS